MACFPIRLATVTPDIAVSLRPDALAAARPASESSRPPSLVACKHIDVAMVMTSRRAPVASLRCETPAQDCRSDPLFQIMGSATQAERRIDKLPISARPVRL